MLESGLDILSGVLFLPLVGGLTLLAVRPMSDATARGFALAVSIFTFGLSLLLLRGFDPGMVLAADSNAPLSYEVRVPWIPRFGISYHLGVDGISLFLVLLTTFMTPLVIVGSWESITDRVRGYHAALLALESAMLGAFLALDAFLFYVFWEAMLIPMYFLIGIWGGPRRIYATVKFFLYTLVGSLLMLVALLKLVLWGAEATGEWSFALRDLMALDVPRDLQVWLFAGFALSFAIKVPIFPFHTWLPDAHVEAPTGGSVILAGILLKMGTYGFLRFAMPLFPIAAHEATPWMFGAAVVGIVYGAWVAGVQQDLKKLVAYSSVSHLGLVMLGLFALNVQGLEGALLQMINHGISTGALFLLVGMLYDRRHTRDIGAFGGIAKVMPVYAALFLVATLSSIGLPGLNGFIGEFLVLVGSFGASKPVTFIAATGMIWGAVYMLTCYQRVFLGPLQGAENERLVDLGRREVLVLLVALAPALWIGIYPQPILRRIEPALTQVIQHVRGEYTRYANQPVDAARQRVNALSGNPS